MNFDPQVYTYSKQNCNFARLDKKKIENALECYDTLHILSIYFYICP